MKNNIIKNNYEAIRAATKNVTCSDYKIKMTRSLLCLYLNYLLMEDNEFRPVDQDNREDWQCDIQLELDIANIEYTHEQLDFIWDVLTEKIDIPDSLEKKDPNPFNGSGLFDAEKEIEVEFALRITNEIEEEEEKCRAAAREKEGIEPD